MSPQVLIRKAGEDNTVSRLERGCKMGYNSRHNAKEMTGPHRYPETQLRCDKISSFPIADGPNPGDGLFGIAPVYMYSVAATILDRDGEKRALEIKSWTASQFGAQPCVDPFIGSVETINRH
jgi:hypothetical protein